MNVKKVILLITTIIALVSLYGIHLFRENRQFGRELYNSVNKMSIQSRLLANAIGYLEKGFADPDWRNKGLSDSSFGNAMISVTSSFGYEDMPLLEDVRSGWSARFTKLWNQIVNKDMDELEKVFLEEADEISNLRIQLENMTKCFRDFGERYNQMSEWERYFVSWKDEQKILNEKVRLR